MALFWFFIPVVRYLRIWIGWWSAVYSIVRPVTNNWVGIDTAVILDTPALGSQAAGLSPPCNSSDSREAVSGGSRYRLSYSDTGSAIRHQGGPRSNF